MLAGDHLQRFWRWFSLAALIVILLVAGIFIFATLPPRTIVIATGAEGGYNYELGMRYRAILAKAGVRLRLLATSGGLENLAQLRDPKAGVGVGFIQSGTTTKEASPELESLGTIFYEPAWLFVRSEFAGNVQALRGRRISIGPEGSAGRALALDVIKKMNFDTGELLGFPPQLAAEKLIAGDIDAAFIVTGWDSPAVQQLMTAKDIELTNVPRPDAYVALYPFLNKLLLPAGVADLAMNRPPADVVLLAPKANLAVRADLHPAIQHLLLNAAVQIHSQPGIFQKAGQFPAAESIDLPLSDEAQRFYKNGRPFLQEHLPFWMAALIERLLVVLVPLVALLYPIFKLLPQTYDWLMQSKIRRLYDEMRSIESEMESGGKGYDVEAISIKLDDLDHRANQLRLPSTYASMLYTLRSHLNLVRARLAGNFDQKSS
jgi:TRAP transporter TAXI family solute receptor